MAAPASAPNTGPTKGIGIATTAPIAPYLAIFLPRPGVALISLWTSSIFDMRLSLIDGEACAQRAHTRPNVRLDLRVPMLALLGQAVEHVGDHMADLAELGRAEA